MERARLRGVVALDGPSGTGKSTVARRLASALDASYLDTGAMYRAVTLAVLRAGVAMTDVAEVTMAAAQVRLTVGTDPASPHVELDGEDVAAEIRGPEVTAAVSAVSAVADIRELLVAEQRRIIAAVLATGAGIVVEGRDIGSVVAPDAGLKVYLTASAEARASRRRKQDSIAGRQMSISATLADVERRDNADSSRTVSPLRRVADAIELDTTSLDARGVIATLRSMVEESGLCGVRGGTSR
ncbi:MAG: (d)CMP kinase [Sciscionella sp.]